MLTHLFILHLTFHHWHEPPDPEPPHGRELSQRRLQEEEGDPGKYQGHEVRDQEGPCMDQHREGSSKHVWKTVIYIVINRFSREEMGGIILNVAEVQSAVISWCQLSKTKTRLPR